MFGFNLLASAQSAHEAAAQPQPQWGSQGMEINNTLGRTSHQNPQTTITSDGNIGVVWEDGRSGFTKIYAQKINSNGTPLWLSGGIAAAPFAGDQGNQNNPQIIDDGSGGLIIIWQGYRKGDADIFAQHVSAQGQLLWGESGVTVCDAPAGQFAPQLTGDDSGGAIITWYDYRGAAGEDIYAQRVGSDGKIMWPTNGLPVCTAAGTQWYPKICPDDKGGAIIVWTDGRSGSSNNDIYGQRLDSSGNILWDKDGLPICAAPQNQERPELLAVEDGAIVAWNDSRGGTVDIYAQKIDLSGSALWQKDGSAVVNVAYSQENPKLAPDGKGGVVVAWVDNREEISAIYAQRINNYGQTVWGESGRRITKSSGSQDNPDIIKLKTSDWVVIFEDRRAKASQLFTQKINSSGIPLWPEGGVAVAPSDMIQEKVAALLDEDGGVVLAWQDRRKGNFDIYGQKISADGTLSWSDNGTVLCDAPGLVSHQNANLIDNSRGEVIVVFEDARSGFFNIYAQKIGRDGALLWGKNGLPVAKIRADQRNPQLVADGAGGAVVAWEDQRDQNFVKIYAQHLTAAGQKSWKGGSLPLTKINSQQTDPQMVSDGSGGALIIWQDERNPLSLKDLYGQRISASGELIWDQNGQAVCAENGDQIEPAVVVDGGGGAYIAWTDYRNGERNPDILAQRIATDGRPLWKKEGVLVCGAPDVQKSPALARDSEDGVVITWTDKGGGSYDIYAQRLNKEGRPLWITDGIPVCQASRTQQNPRISDRLALVWEDYRYGNWDIFANSLSTQGKLLWGEEGASISSLPLTQYAPQIADWKNNGSLFAWEDYRNGKQYLIYFQGVGQDGKPLWTSNGVMVSTADGARAPKLVTLPEEGAFVIIWEDYSGGGKSIFGQKFQVQQ